MITITITLEYFSMITITYSKFSAITILITITQTRLRLLNVITFDLIFIKSNFKKYHITANYIYTKFKIFNNKH